MALAAACSGGLGCVLTDWKSWRLEAEGEDLLKICCFLSYLSGGKWSQLSLNVTFSYVALWLNLRIIGAYRYAVDVFESETFGETSWPKPSEQCRRMRKVVKHVSKILCHQRNPFCARRELLWHILVFLVFFLTHYYNTFKTLILLVHPFGDLTAILVIVLSTSWQVLYPHLCHLPTFGTWGKRMDMSLSHVSYQNRGFMGMILPAINIYNLY